MGILFFGVKSNERQLFCFALGECLYSNFYFMQTSSNHHKEQKKYQPSIENSDRKFEVICRVRPLQQAETSQDIAIGDGSPTITIFNHPKNISKEFTFHRVYGQNTRQVDFTRTIVDEIFLNCLQNGKGSLILSYGVTNSGKTYTILGKGEEPGVLPTLIAKLEAEKPNEKIFIRAMEVYTDDIYCLRNGERLQLRQAWGGYEFIGGCQYQEITKKTTKEIIDIFIGNRKAAETNANRASSRSHAIFMIQCGEFHLGITDLAGNERFGTNANFQQTFSINKNLLVLGKCIHAFRDGDRMPYRQCKLTLALMEYFKPSYKIFMIAHLNRSGQMFHENVNVLEYAAVSTQVKHLNLKKNPSIMKSMKKREKSFVDLSEKKHEPNETERRQNKFLLEKYKSYIMGVNAQAEEDLDQYFKQEDEKDLKFLKDLKEMQYVSPAKSKKLWLDKLEAQSRIKLREIFLSEMRADKADKLAECATEMGPSMQKNYQPLFQQSEKKPQSPKKVETANYGSSMGTSMKKNLWHYCRISSQKPMNTQQLQESLTTPLKYPSNPESESFIKRVMKNPAIMIQSGFRMINNINQVATNMMESFKEIIGHHEQFKNIDQQPQVDLGEAIDKATRFAIKNQSEMKIIVTGQICPNLPLPPFSSAKKPSESASKLNSDQEAYQDQYQQTKSANRSSSPEKINIENRISNIYNAEESQLLDGLYSEKEVSTNRSSDLDFFKSESSKKFGQKPIEVIPELVQSETTTKMPMNYSAQGKNSEISMYLREKENKKPANIHNAHMEVKLNETGFKSTQETLIQQSQFQPSDSKSITNVSKSVSRKKIQKQSHLVEKIESTDLKKYLVSSKKVSIKKVSTSAIKTRNQRKKSKK